MNAMTAAMLAALALGALPLPAQAQQAGKLFFEGDMVNGPRPNQAGPFCVLRSTFKRGELVAWRVRVLAGDGAPADDKKLKSVVVEISDGRKVPLKYGGHPPRPPQTDWFWSGSWEIPADFPTGSLSYKVVATDSDGRTQTWEPFKVATSQLTVVPGELARPQ